MKYRLTWFNRGTGWKIVENFDSFNKALERQKVLRLLCHEVHRIEEVE